MFTQRFVVTGDRCQLPLSSAACEAPKPSYHEWRPCSIGFVRVHLIIIWCVLVYANLCWCSSRAWLSGDLISTFNTEQAKTITMLIPIPMLFDGKPGSGRQQKKDNVGSFQVVYLPKMTLGARMGGRFAEARTKSNRRTHYKYKIRKNKYTSISILYNTIIISVESSCAPKGFQRRLREASPNEGEIQPTKQLTRHTWHTQEPTLGHNLRVKSNWLETCWKYLQTFCEYLPACPITSTMCAVTYTPCAIAFTLCPIPSSPCDITSKPYAITSTHFAITSTLYPNL